MNDFDIIIGGSGDIGYAIVKELVTKGRNVIYTYNQNLSIVDTIKRELPSDKEIIGLKLDTTSKQDLIKLSNFIIKRQVKIRSLIYNVGKTKDQLFTEMSEEDFLDVMNTNINGCFRVCKVLIDQIAINKGNIVLISSISGMIGRIGQVNYSCSKAALIALGRNLAAEYSRIGVRVNTIAPGYIKTKMLTNFSEKDIKEIKSKIPLKELGDVTDVSKMVYFLISDESKYITGQTIVIDGGVLNK